MNGSGYFFEPTSIADMAPSMLSHGDKIFAPVAAFHPFDTEEEVMELAGNTDVRLGSYVCINNIGRMWRVGEDRDAGMVGVNTCVIAGGELPFASLPNSATFNAPINTDRTPTVHHLDKLKQH